MLITQHLRFIVTAWAQLHGLRLAPGPAELPVTSGARVLLLGCCCRRCAPLREAAAVCAEATSVLLHV
jgi:hypothetical protein